MHTSIPAGSADVEQSRDGVLSQRRL